MNAVVLYNFKPVVINGTVINAIEYYLCMYEHNKNVVLVLLNTTEETKQLFISMIEERYYLDSIEGYKDNIILFNTKQLINTKFDKVLVVDYSTIKKTKGLINSKKIIVISDLHTTDSDYFYSKKLNDVTYYGEMPFVYKDEEYKMKMLFNRYKMLDSVKETTYIHSPKNPDTSFVKDLTLPDQPIMFRQPGHLKNLFTHFNLFVYYHAHTWFDPCPRLMHESHFYGKDIIYINDFNLKDGSWYRYKDLMDNGFKGRFLNKNDEVVRQMI